MILYVQKNEETSHLKIIHFYEEEDGVPSELEANSKSEIFNLSLIYTAQFLIVLDEAFPEITIDLVCHYLHPRLF